MNARASWVQGVAVAGLVGVSAMAQTVVYQNTETPLDNYFASQTEFGDQITIAGGGFQATAFTFEYFAAGLGGGESAVVRFWGNDGLPLGDGGIQAPGSLLWQSPSFPIVNGNFPISIVDIPAGVDLPSSFTWSVAPTGVTGGEVFGLKLYDPPTVGSSFDDIWQFTAGGWDLVQIDGVRANFGAELIAIPEPSVMSLLGLGGLALLLRRRAANS